MKEKFLDAEPETGHDVWIHPQAVVTGRVKLGPSVSVWPGAVLRGDVDSIEVGEASNIQDLAVLHPDRGRPVVLGPGVTVGHRAIVHGSRIGEHCLIGMGAIVIDSEIGEFSLIGAGAVVTPGTSVPPGSLVLGMPGKIVRALSDEEKAGLVGSRGAYVELAELHRKRGSGS